MSQPLDGLVKKAIRLKVYRKGQQLLDQVYQHTPIRIGRLLDNDVVVPFDFASRYHCEIRFDGEKWSAVDLGSKNGLLTDGTTRVDEVQLDDGSEFRIQEVTIQLTYEKAEEIARNFESLRDAQTVIGFTNPNIRLPASPSADQPKGSPQKQIAPQASWSKEESDPSYHLNHAAIGGKIPLVDTDLNDLLFEPHPMIHQAREKAVQMVVIWHDQVLDAREFPVGSSLVWEWMGEEIHLGSVRSEKTTVKIPKGCQPSATAGPGSTQKSLAIALSQPGAFRMSDALFVYFRYVPRSKDIAVNTKWLDDRLVDPVIMSSAIHGAAAITTLFVSPKPHGKVENQQPERHATIIIAPTPPPIAALPTPTPTPVPVPSPTPPEKQVAKKPEPPKEKVKVVQEKVKKRPPAVAKAEKPEGKKVEVKLPPPPKEKQLVKSDTNAAQGNDDKPAPSPQPFQPKSVGALKMLSALNPGPAANVAGVEKIQISRSTASTTGTLMGREPVQGTGDIISNLNQSATGGGTGKGDGTSGVALGGKGAAGAYQVAGLSGKAGKSNVRGSVLGGATYTELSKNEGLTREQVMKVVQKYQSQIQQCYERSLMSNPDIVGRAEFEWEIAANGKVNFVKVKEATIKNGENLLDCVKGVFAKMQFPQAKNGEQTTPTIGLPFGRL